MPALLARRFTASFSGILRISMRIENNLRGRSGTSLPWSRDDLARWRQLDRPSSSPLSSDVMRQGCTPVIVVLVIAGIASVPDRSTVASAESTRAIAQGSRENAPGPRETGQGQRENAQPRENAQGPHDLSEDERERLFIEGLRREDPAIAERYVQLRDARAHARSELELAEGRYRAAGPELRGAFIGPVRQAQRTYAQSSLALLDFLDDRERRAIERYREQIDRINAVLEQHRRVRADLEKLLRGE